MVCSILLLHHQADIVQLYFGAKVLVIRAIHIQLKHWGKQRGYMEGKQEATIPFWVSADHIAA